MAFEVVDKRMATLAKSLAVTIQKRGIFSINKVAHEMIGSAETVELLYDKEARIIAMRPVEGSPPHAYAMRSQSKRETGQTILSATAFTQYYDIDTSVSRRWEPYKQGDMRSQLEEHRDPRQSVQEGARYQRGDRNRFWRVTGLDEETPEELFREVRLDLLAQDEPVHPEGLSCLLQQLLAYRSFLQSLGVAASSG